MASYEDTPLLPDKESTLPWFQLSILAFVQIAEPITLCITQAFTNRVSICSFHFKYLFIELGLSSSKGMKRGRYTMLV